MLNKLSFLAGVGAGYVLGARSGRGHYDQLKAQSAKAWQSDPVQSKVADAQSKVAEAADALKAKAPAQAQPLVDKAVSAVTGGTTSSSSTTPTTTTGASVSDATYASNPVGMPGVPATDDAHRS